MEEEEDWTRGKRAVDMDLEVVRGEDESREDGEETRKGQVDWKNMKLEAEIRDLLSSDRKMCARRREGSRQKSCWEARMWMRWIKSIQSHCEGLKKSWKRTGKKEG